MYGGFQPVYPPKRQSDGLHPGSYIYKALHIYRSPRTNQGSDETPETGTWFHGVTGSGMWLELGSQERGLPSTLDIWVCQDLHRTPKAEAALDTHT